ncbi:MAG: HAMP domain-containing methyl-accepting chemotaxis protein [Thalassobaculales bacterium]
MSSLLSRLSIQWQVIVGFLLVLLLVVLLAANGFRGQRLIGAEVEDLGTASGNAVAVQATYAEFVEARRQADGFFGDRGSGDRAQLDAQLARVGADVAAIADRARQAETRDALQRVAAKISTYRANLARAIDLEEKRRAAVENTLNPLGNEMQRGLSRVLRASMNDDQMEVAAAAGLAEEALLLFRLEVQRFFTTGEQSVAREALASMLALRRGLASLLDRVVDPDSAEIARSVEGKIAEFGETFRQVLEITNQTNEIVRGENARLAEEIGGEMASLRQGQLDRLRQRQAEVASTMGDVTTTGMIVAGAAIGIGLVLAWLIGRGIAVPVQSMTAAMGSLAAGDLGTEVPSRERRDEIGRMAAAVQVFKESMTEAERLRGEQEAQKARAAEERRRAMRELADAFESKVGGVVRTVSSAATEMQASAQSLQATAEETSRQSAAVAAASEQATSNVQTVAAAAEELNASIGEIGRQVNGASTMAREAAGQAEQTDRRVQALAESAQRIGDVVKLISDIAAQTNLLALNATIEAARAGDAGKGFAVVAAEVKNLATQTSRATEDIAQQVAAIQGATGEAVAAIQAIGRIIQEMNTVSSTIASAVEEQNASTQEIARNVQQAAAGTQEVSSNIAGVTQAAGHTGSASSQLLGAAQDLSVQSETLRAEVERFLAEVRSA